MNQLNPKLEMLMSREQLMIDIKNIMDEHFDAVQHRDAVIEELLDAVCKHFPAE